MQGKHASEKDQLLRAISNAIKDANRPPKDLIDLSLALMTYQQVQLDNIEMMVEALTKQIEAIESDRMRNPSIIWMLRNHPIRMIFYVAFVLLALYMIFTLTSAAIDPTAILP